MVNPKIFVVPSLDRIPKQLDRLLSDMGELPRLRIGFPRDDSGRFQQPIEGILCRFRQNPSRLGTSIIVLKHYALMALAEPELLVCDCKVIALAMPILKQVADPHHVTIHRKE